MTSLPSSTALLVFVALVLLPVVCSWLIAVLPSRRRELSGFTLGNPIRIAPLAPVAPVVTHPLVYLSRSLSSSEVEGFVLGLRHLPVEQTAPLLTRFMNGNDPALQLYAQSILQQGRDQLNHQFHELLGHQPADDPRVVAWLLQTGLSLAQPTLCSSTERPGFLKYLAKIAMDRLEIAPHTPSLLGAASEVFLQAGMLAEALALISRLPPSWPLSTRLQPAITHAYHQQLLA